MLTAAKSLQSCPTLCDPVDSSPPGSPVPGVLQAKTLEWVAISFSKRKTSVRTIEKINKIFNNLSREDKKEKESSNGFEC